MFLYESAVAKHGSHNQASHGRGGKGNSGGEPRRRGKDIMDLSESDRKEFTARMASAKNMEEARAIIEEFKPKLKKQNEIIQKHGSHNQKTHAGSRSKGGASGPVEDMQNDAKEAVAAVDNMIKGAKESLQRTQSKASNTPFLNSLIERHKGVVKGFQDAQRLIGKPKELAKLKSTMNRAKKDVRLPRTSRLDRAFVEGYADAAIQVATSYGYIDLEM